MRLETWLGAFIATIALELPIVVAGTFPRLGWGSIALGLLLQGATHPALWFVLPQFEPYAAWLVFAEGLVVAVEAALIAGALWTKGAAPRQALLRGLVVSLLANSFSTGVGLALRG